MRRFSFAHDQQAARHVRGERARHAAEREARAAAGAAARADHDHAGVLLVGHVDDHVCGVALARVLLDGESGLDEARSSRASTSIATRRMSIVSWRRSCRAARGRLPRVGGDEVTLAPEPPPARSPCGCGLGTRRPVCRPRSVRRPASAKRARPGSATPVATSYISASTAKPSGMAPRIRRAPSATRGRGRRVGAVARAVGVADQDRAAHAEQRLGGVAASAARRR